MLRPPAGVRREGSRAARLLHMVRRVERGMLSYDRTGWLEDEPCKPTGCVLLAMRDCLLAGQRSTCDPVHISGTSAPCQHPVMAEDAHVQALLPPAHVVRRSLSAAVMSMLQQIAKVWVPARFLALCSSLLAVTTGGWRSAQRRSWALSSCAWTPAGPWPARARPLRRQAAAFVTIFDSLYG